MADQNVPPVNGTDNQQNLETAATKEFQSIAAQAFQSLGKFAETSNETVKETLGAAKEFALKNKTTTQMAAAGGAIVGGGILAAKLGPDLARTVIDVSKSFLNVKTAVDTTSKAFFDAATGFNNNAEFFTNSFKTLLSSAAEAKQKSFDQASRARDSQIDPKLAKILEGKTVSERLGELQSERQLPQADTKAIDKDIESIKKYSASMSQSQRSAEQQLETTKKSLELISVLGERMLQLGDKLSSYRKETIRSTLATSSWNQVSTELFTTLDKGAVTAAEKTGQSVGEIQEGFSRLTDYSTMVSQGFKVSIADQISATEQATKNFETYGNAVIVARNTGLQFSDVSDSINTLLKSQGQGAEQTLESILRLKQSTADTGLTMQQSIGALKELSQAFEFASFNADEAALTIGKVANIQRDLGAEARYSYKSPQQAIESYGKALQSVAKTQQDFGSALLYSGLQGKGLEGMGEFMFDQTPQQAMKTMFSGVEKMFGGEMLTYPQAREQGRIHEFIPQMMMIQKQFGLQSPQEASRFVELQKAINLTTSEQEELKNLTANEKDLLKQAGDRDKDFYQKTYTQGEIANTLLSGLQMQTAQIARGITYSAMIQTVEAGGKAAEAMKEFGLTPEEIKGSLKTQYKNLTGGTTAEDYKKAAVAITPEAQKQIQQQQNQQIEKIKQPSEALKDKTTEQFAKVAIPVKQQLTTVNDALSGTTAAYTSGITKIPVRQQNDLSYKDIKQAIDSSKIEKQKFEHTVNVTVGFDQNGNPFAKQIEKTVRELGDTKYVPKPKNYVELNKP
jgi:hypothetical protein